MDASPPLLLGTAGRNALGTRSWSPLQAGCQACLSELRTMPGGMSIGRELQAEVTPSVSVIFSQPTLIHMI